MNEQLQLDFDKIIKTLKISEKEIQLRKSFLKKLLTQVFRIENKKTGSFWILVKLLKRILVI